MTEIKVLTVDDVKIDRFRWWSNWVDVGVFTHGGDGYLLQMKISRFNAKKFITRSYISGIRIDGTYVSHSAIGDLVQMAGNK